MNLIQVQKPSRSWISLTPLIDVVFILLMFFMLTTQFYQTGVMNLSVAGTQTNTAVSDTPTVTIELLAGGLWRIAGTDESLGENDLYQLDPSVPVRVVANDAVSLQEVVGFLDRLAGIGVEKTTWLSPGSDQ